MFSEDKALEEEESRIEDWTMGDDDLIWKERQKKRKTKGSTHDCRGGKSKRRESKNRLQEIISK